MTKQITQFENLDIAELETAIREILEGVAYVDRPRDERVDVEPYVGLIDLYKSSLPDFKDRMASVFKVLIESELETLSDSGKHNLFRVLQDCGDRLIDTIETTARRQTLVAKSKELHALVLKCLISLDCRQSSEFWLKQLDALGPDYGAVILSGLLQHGIETGFRHLPQLTLSDTAARRIAMALPSIDDQFGEDEVKRELKTILPLCRIPVQNVIQIVFPADSQSGREQGGKQLRKPISKNWAEEIAKLTDVQFISFVVWFRDTLSAEQIEFIREEVARRDEHGADMHEVWEEIRLFTPAN